MNAFQLAENIILQTVLKSSLERQISIRRMENAITVNPPELVPTERSNMS